MEINILGSGTCVPSLERRPCSALIRTEQVHFLLDAGSGTMDQLLKLGISIHEIDVIFLSHFHLDHCAEVAPFLFASKYPKFNRKKPLSIVGGQGLIPWFERLSRAFDNSIDMPSNFLDLIEVDESGQFDLGGIHVSYDTMAHKPESRGYRFTDPGGFSLVYSGDTDYSDRLVGLAKGADILICESAMPDGQKVPGHLTPSLAGEMASRAGVKQLVLTHFYPECDDVDVVAQCQRTFSGPVRAARDLMIL